MTSSTSTYAPAPAPQPRRRRHGGVLGPLLLIFIGAVFLLQNTGHLPPNLWPNLWRLWPLVLVLAGLERLLGHRLPRFVLAVTALVVMVIGLAATVSSLPPTPAPVVSRTVETPLSGATQAAVTIRFGAGELDVGARPRGTGDVLASMSYDGSSDAVPQPRYTVAPSGAAELSYQAGGRGGGFAPFGANPDQSRMAIELNPGVPISSMTVQTGVTDAHLDLDLLTVKNLEIAVGAASTWLRVPQAPGTTTAHISGGASTITIEVPQGVAASIRHRGGLSTVTVDTARFPQVGDGLYRSVDYDTAASRVDVTLETGITTIQVR